MLRLVKSEDVEVGKLRGSVSHRKHLTLACFYCDIGVGESGVVEVGKLRAPVSHRKHLTLACG